MPRPKWLLVVDDDPAILAILEGALAHPGLTITTASDAPQSFIVGSYATACAPTPRTQDVPLVLITGRGDATIRRRLGEKPPQVLFKPFPLDALLQAVAQALGSA